MTYRALLSLSLFPFLRRMKKWWIKRRIADIDKNLHYIRAQRANDFKAERVLQSRQAFLTAELIDL